jgi:choline-glycine betaine transporter
MITWPIYIALLLSVSAVYFSIKAEDNKIRNEQEEKEKKEFKRLDLIKRKQRIENNKQED